MKNLISTKNLLVKILTLLLLFNITLLASNLQGAISNDSYMPDVSSMEPLNTLALAETVEVSLDSFSNIGVMIMIVLSSLLGAYFVRDEFSSMLE